MTRQQMIDLSEMYQRVSAWRDNARLMLIRALPQDEARWQNEYDNYSSLCGLMIRMTQDEQPRPSISECGFRTWT